MNNPTLGRRLCSTILALVTVACGGGSTTGPTDSGDSSQPPYLTSIQLSPGTIITQPGGSQTITVTAKDNKGQSMSGRSMVIGSSAPVIATVSTTGQVTAESVGTATITVTDVLTNIKGAAAVTVQTPIRPASSMISMTQDSLAVVGALWGTVIAYTEATASGKDVRIGFVRTKSETHTRTRAGTPRMSAIAECADGSLYGVNYVEGQVYLSLWRIDVKTGEATLVGGINDMKGYVRSLVCLNDGGLIAAGEWAGFGSLWSVAPSSARATLMSSVTLPLVMGMARAPNGTIYATTWNRSAHPDEGAFLMTVNPSTGAMTRVGTNQAPHFPRVSDLAFVGQDLFAASSGTLYRLDLTTGAVTTVRSINIP